jgi:predicted transcriptional regulator
MMTSNILHYLRMIPAADMIMICEDLQSVGNPDAIPKNVQPALDQLDDAGLVFVKAGVYRLSDEAKLRGC